MPTYTRRAYTTLVPTALVHKPLIVPTYCSLRFYPHVAHSTYNVIARLPAVFEGH